MRDDFKEQPITTRLGSSNEDNKHPLVKMVCENADQKYKILKNSRHLATCDRTKDIYIGPDLTRKERVSDKQMCDELKERRGVKPTSLLEETRSYHWQPSLGKQKRGRRRTAGRWQVGIQRRQHAGGGPQGGGK